MALVVQDRTFLDALSDEARKDLLRISVERTFRADEHLLREQDDSSHVLVLLAGWAVVSTKAQRVMVDQLDQQAHAVQRH
ncbi:hypothetical protein AB0926_08595 [Streptomyces griseoincarnatus]